MMKKQYFVVLLVLFFIGCSKSEKQADYTVEQIKLINQVTSGTISATEPILIHFSDEVNNRKITEDLSGSSLFQFSPSIEGAIQWRDKQTLEFIPNGPLQTHGTYKGSLNLSKLLPQEEWKEPEFPISFSVRGNGLLNLEYDYQLVSFKNPKEVTLFGKIEFIDSVSFDLLKSKVQFSGDRDLQIIWKETSRGKSFEFTSNTFSRTDEKLNFRLEIDKSAFDLNETVIRRIFVSPLSTLSVASVYKQGHGADGKVIVSFSETLDNQKDWASYLTVEPSVEIQVSVHDRQLILNAPFKSGESYKIKVQKGIESKWGTKLSQDHQSDIVFQDEKPRIKFANDGIYLPSSNQKQIALRLVNVKRFYLVVERIYEHQLSSFFKYRSLSGAKTYKEGQHYKTYNLKSIGEHVKSEWIEVNPPKNEWVNIDLDLKGLIGEKSDGLYVVRAVFNIADVMYNETESEIYDSDNSPLSQNYYTNFGKTEKYIIQTDFALTVKRTGNEILVFTHNILTTEPEPGVKIKVKTRLDYQTKTATTNSQGVAKFNNPTTSTNDVWFIEASNGNSSTYLKLEDSRWDKTLFQTSGEQVETSGTNVFLYSDRGVYRPGDPVNLSGIARNAKGSFPPNHPISLQIMNPLGQLYLEKVNKNSHDGVFSFSFKTEPEDPTGTWIAEVSTGSKTIRKPIKIETVVPDKFLVTHTFNSDQLVQNKEINVNLNAKYLFGTPAKNRRFTVTSEMKEGPYRFSGYSQFIFHNETKEFSSHEETLIDKELDENGNAEFTHRFENFSEAPGRLTWELTTKVFEPGGRFTKKLERKIYDPYTAYVGIKKPNSYWLASGTDVKLDALLLDTKGVAIPNRVLTYKVYLNKEIWWYDYGSQSAFHKRYKENTQTIEIARGELSTKQTPVPLVFTPTTNGEILVEVTDGETGHTSAIFLHAYSWGDDQLNAQAYHVSIKMDKEKYTVGETARFVVPTPTQGKILYSIEKNDQVLLYDSKKVSGEAETTLEIPITEVMAPNVYLSLSIIQPHNQTTNDRPIRLFGITPVYVFDPNSKLNISIDPIESLEPNKPFRISLNTGEKSQVTLAVIDEGLLSLTNFRTPDPWMYFNKKQMLETETFDGYFHVIGADWGETFKTFKIGGDYSFSAGKDAAKKRKLMRFKPTALFSGPLETDASGKLTVHFTMPEYIGAVRVMAVATQGKKYGNAEMSVPVKTDLMILPTIPRELGPSDTFTLPVTVFSMKNSPLNTELELTTEGPVKIIGESKQRVSFEKSGEKHIYFKLSTDAAIGEAKIKISAKSQEKVVQNVTDIAIKASNPKIHNFHEAILKQNQPAEFVSEITGIKGTNTKKITISKAPKFRIGHRLEYLIRYPYGCIEQTTSSVFPQLYLSSVLEDPSKQNKMDKHINAGIQRLKQFQTSSGGFSYWPGQTETNAWGTNYAGHFLIEARKKGYAVSHQLFQQWMAYQKHQVRRNQEATLEQTYRLYLLALAGEPQLSAMNMIKESHLGNISTPSRWMLAMAYHLAGLPDVASELVKNASLQIDQYTEFSGTYGSHIRDRAMLLEACTLLKRNDDAMKIYYDLLEELSSERWYATQTLAYSLLSIGKFMDSRKSEDEEMSGTIELNGTTIPFKTNEYLYTYNYASDVNDKIKITLNSNQTLYAFYEWSGIPLREGVVSDSKKFVLDVNWYDEEGQKIDPSQVVQGSMFYGHFRVSMNQKLQVDEVVLDQILPSGWEIENLRLNDESLPSWMRDFQLNREEYLDIRDGRVMWFFDYSRYGDHSYDFVIKLNAVTVGEFFLAPTKVEAMYNNKYRAVVAGQKVSVVPSK